MVHNKHRQVHFFTYSPHCHQQISTSIWFINHNYSPSTQQHQPHKQLWIISTSCNAPRHDTYMHVVPNHLRGRHPWCQLYIIITPNNWIQRILQQHVMMHEHMTHRQCTCSHNFINRHQHFSLHAYTNKSTPLHVWKFTNIYAHIHI